MADRYEILLLEPIPTGVEHMGAVEMTSEPREQTFAPTFEAAIADAERFIREWRDAVGTREAWEDAYAPIHALSKLDEAGGTVGPFGRHEGLEVMVRLRTAETTAKCETGERTPMNCWSCSGPSREQQEPTT